MYLFVTSPDIVYVLQKMPREVVNGSPGCAVLQGRVIAVGENSNIGYIVR